MPHSRLNDAVEWLERLVAIDTISTKSNTALIDLISHNLQTQHGIACAQVCHDDKASLFATIGPATNGGIMLSAHTDVVEVANQAWDTDPFQLIKKGELLYGRGTCDMKGFIACVMAMVPQFTQIPLKKPLHIALSRDEEIGCAGAEDIMQMVADSGNKPAVALVGEPTGMQTVAGHKGGMTMQTIFQGQPAHSSLPALGVSAITPAAQFVNYLDGLEKEMVRQADKTSPFNPPHGTINVGILRGGTALNILAGKCVVDWHYRPMPDDDLDKFLADTDEFLQKKLLPAMSAGGHNVSISNHCLFAFPGLLPKQSPALELVETLTDNTERKVVSFGTEAGHFQSNGISSVVIGPGDIEQAHKPNEYITYSQLEECLTFLGKVVAHLAA